MTKSAAPDRMKLKSGASPTSPPPTPSPEIKRLGFAEFCALMAFLISMVALSIDIMLPVIDGVAQELGEHNPNKAQNIILSMFLGLALGQFIYGPVSDTTGRKPAIMAGLAVFVFGTIICLIAKDFNTMLAGRFLQGLGAAGPRIISMAIIRDLYSGRAMAQVTSVIMAFFIMVPAMAPAIGQAVINISSWPFVFYLLMAQAVVCALWYGLRQAETLDPDHQAPLSLRKIFSDLKQVASNKISLTYTIAAGTIIGAFLGYLITSPQIFKDVYGIVDHFPYYFAACALAIGASSFFNVRLVTRLGMRKLCRIALLVQICVSVLFFGLYYVMGQETSLVLFMVWALIAFFMQGFLFGNFNAIAMEPLGHIAGIGSAFVGGVSTLLSMVIGGAIGHFYDGNVLPCFISFAVLGALSLSLMIWAEPDRHIK